MKTSHTDRKAPALTCRDMGLTEIDAAILMRNITRAFIGQRDDQLAYEQARYQHRTRPWRTARGHTLRQLALAYSGF